MFMGVEMNTSQETRAAAARAELNRRYAANELLQRQVEHAARLSRASGLVNYLADDDVHTLWSDGSDDGAFANTHECWDLLETVG